MKIFDEKFMKGYLDNQLFFKSWCDRAYIALGKITQTGFIEVHRSGELFICGNRPEVGEDAIENEVWLHQDIWSFVDGFYGRHITLSSNSYYHDLGAYTSKIPHFWFTVRDRVNNDMQRITFFAAESPEIHGAYARNYFMVIKLIDKFISELNDISKTAREHMVDMSSVKPDFLIDIKSYNPRDIDKLNEVLKKRNKLITGERVTEREWKCLDLFCQGKSVKETAIDLEISSRTVETYFGRLKDKLNVTTKSEILEVIT